METVIANDKNSGKIWKILNCSKIYPTVTCLFCNFWRPPHKFGKKWTKFLSWYLEQPSTLPKHARISDELIALFPQQLMQIHLEHYCFA